MSIIVLTVAIISASPTTMIPSASWVKTMMHLNFTDIGRIKYANANWYYFCNFLSILTAMDKSEIRKMYNGDFICKKEIEHNGIIPLIYKRIICVLWKGHNYIPVSPEDLDGKRLFECKYCKKQRVL